MLAAWALVLLLIAVLLLRRRDTMSDALRAEWISCHTATTVWLLIATVAATVARSVPPPAYRRINPDRRTAAPDETQSAGVYLGQVVAMLAITTLSEEYAHRDDRGHPGGDAATADRASAKAADAAL